ncbi:MAG: DUF445 family protein [Anaerostipes sp.]|uniref:DUF445 domain-containing protein n=1 Tax=Anaerostipes sp. 992a TaxID=1261637 RepID=UPI000951D04E|nr:DUF445 family protein [Anaerostipes sp. 992a]MCI5951658.1 DUF445 family protein [Anaerostipes sp.]MDD5969167.1 DUF445 family protein [Anaerostipes sp.]OLR62225.1 hypothetical protein BHF69_05775 [Anaerostipes sp. 992a]
MNLMMLSGPIIGAVIGYFTNSIAIKMMFRPLHPVKIGNFTLPFTPGIIPKGQGRLAKAIGKTVGEQLLTEDVLTKRLLSDAMKEKVVEETEQFLRKQQVNENSFNEILLSYAKQEKINEKKDQIVEVIMEKVVYYLKEVQLGDIVANEVLNAAKQYVQGTFLAMMINDDMLMPIARKIAERVDAYVDGDGICLIRGAINAEAEKLLNQQVSVYANQLVEEKESIENVVLAVYESFIREQMHRFLQQMDLCRLVEDKINEMDVAEVEELVLSIMKKELHSVINLGAVIGFVIGLVNMAF